MIWTTITYGTQDDLQNWRFVERDSTRARPSALGVKAAEVGKHADGAGLGC